jgi:nucleoside-diphosphate-sugar epimerase
VQSLILVTGTTGHVGRHVVSQLLHTGTSVRALTRNPDSTGLAGDVDVVRGDLSIPDTLLEEPLIHMCVVLSGCHVHLQTNVGQPGSRKRVKGSGL